MSGRPMKYPYTLSAKIAQFPFETYLFHKRSWLIRYWFLGNLVCIPFFAYITNLSYNEANVKKWDEIHKEQFSGKRRH